MKIIKTESLQHLRNYVLFALLISFAVGITFFVNEKQNADDTLSIVITESADYARDFEDTDDNNHLFLLTQLVSQTFQINWQGIVNKNTFSAFFSSAYYRARPRSPPMWF